MPALIAGYRVLSISPSATLPAVAGVSRLLLVSRRAELLTIPVVPRIGILPTGTVSALLQSDLVEPLLTLFLTNSIHDGLGRDVVLGGTFVNLFGGIVDTRGVQELDRIFGSLKDFFFELTFVLPPVAK